MWHKPCRTFHPWCPCIKTRCLFGCMQAIHQLIMGRYMLHILTLGELVNLMAYFSTGFAWKLRGTYMKNIPRSSTKTGHSHTLRILWDFAVFKNSLRSLVNSLRYPWFSMEWPFAWALECVGTLANSSGHYGMYVSDVRSIVAPSPAIYGVTMRSSWPTSRRKWQLCFEQ